MTFAKLLRTARKERGVTMRDLSKAVGVSLGYVCDVEHGRRKAFTLDHAAKAETFLGITDGRLVNAANLERQPKLAKLQAEIAELRARILTVKLLDDHHRGIASLGSSEPTAELLADEVSKAVSLAVRILEGTATESDYSFMWGWCPPTKEGEE